VRSPYCTKGTISGGAAKSINTGQRMVFAMKGTVGIHSFGLHPLLTTFDICIASQAALLLWHCAKVQLISVDVPETMKHNARARIMLHSSTDCSHCTEMQSRLGSDGVRTPIPLLVAFVCRRLISPWSIGASQACHDSRVEYVLCGIR
jgi:hypothetical protein